MFNAICGRRGRLLASLPLAFGACLVLVGSTSSVMAAGVLLSTGFENPPYVLGPLQGQSSWVASPASGASTANIQNTITHGGSGQAVLVTRAANSNRRWAVPQSAGYPTQRFVTIDWDMRVAQSSGAAGTFGPFFGVEAYPVLNGQLLLGSLGVDATTGDILYQLEGTGELRETGSTVAFNQWFHYKLVFDFLNHTYEGFVNSTSVAETGFVDGNTLNTFTDADIAALAASFDPGSQALTGSAVFDNFIIRDGLPGDYDQDGDVDNSDYAPWRAAFGRTVTAGHGADGNANGVVDAADYVVWKNNLGASLFASPGLGSAVVVPEPASLLMAGLALAVIGSTGTRRRRS